MEKIRDMLYVKSLERKLRRKLTDEELDGNYFEARLPDGRYEVYRVPILSFPYDLISKPEDLVIDLDFRFTV